MATFKERVKSALQLAPATTITVCRLVGPEIEPLPLIVQEYFAKPAGAENWELDDGHTEAGPEMEHAGIGATVRIISDFSMQPLDWSTVRRRVALDEETCAVVLREFVESIVAEPETTLQVVEAIGWRPCVAWPCNVKAVEAP